MALRVADPTGTWREVRHDDRVITIVIKPDLTFRQTEPGKSDFAGQMQNLRSA